MQNVICDRIYKNSCQPVQLAQVLEVAEPVTLVFVSLFSDSSVAYIRAGLVTLLKSVILPYHVHVLDTCILSILPNFMSMYRNSRTMQWEQSLKLHNNPDRLYLLQ